MSERRFIVESVSIIDDCNEDKSRIAKVITDKEEIYSYNDLYAIVDLLNEQQDTINKQENEIMKLKSLLNFSEKMMDTDLIINLKYSYGKWNADLRVIDDE